MGAHSRRKGRSGELDVQRRLNEIGGDAELNYGQPELGGDKGDVLSNYGAFEIKRRASFPSWLNLRDGVRGVYCRRDRGEWYVVVRASDYEVLLSRVRAFLEEKYVDQHEVTESAK